MLNTRAIADCFAYEYQCRGMDERTMTRLASCIAGLIDDAGERATFIDLASMSGLEIVDPARDLDDDAYVDRLTNGIVEYHVYS